MTLAVPAIKFSQKSAVMYLAVLTINELNEFSIDTYDPKNVVGKRGYQRDADEKRIKNIAHYLSRKDALMPVAGLLNVREKGRIGFRNGMLTIPDGVRVWVVDMQHRLKGLALAHEDHVRGIDDFQFPVVITEGLSQVDEAAQFYVINTKSKKMDVALTRRLLIEHERVADISDVKPWEVSAVIAAIEIERIPGPWRGKIRGPNEGKLPNHIATEKSFVSSLKTLFSDRDYGDRAARKTARRLNIIWAVLAETMPEPFAEPKKYLLQKTAGMFVINYFLAPRILATSKTDRQLREKAARIAKLGPKFWSRKYKSGASKFGTGMGAYARLAAFVAVQCKIR